VTSGIPAVMWYTVALGVFINIFLLMLFDLRFLAFTSCSAASFPSFSRP
jgi:hypothetical protein